MEVQLKREKLNGKIAMSNSVLPKSVNEAEDELHYQQMNVYIGSVYASYV